MELAVCPPVGTKQKQDTDDTDDDYFVHHFFLFSELFEHPLLFQCIFVLISIFVFLGRIIRVCYRCNQMCGVCFAAHFWIFEEDNREVKDTKYGKYYEDKKFMPKNCSSCHNCMPFVFEF